MRVGCVMTNQSRKDWAVAAAVARELIDRIGDVNLWWHCDIGMRYWNMYALLDDFGLTEHVFLTFPPCDDKWLAAQYRACDVTILPSLGEGFGYPLFESMACGTPVVHGDYASGASLMATCGVGRWLVEPQAWRMEGQFNAMRPVHDPAAWVERVIDVVAVRPEREWTSGQVEHLSWKKLAITWQRWFEEGL